MVLGGSGGSRITSAVIQGAVPTCLTTLLDKEPKWQEGEQDLMSHVRHSQRANTCKCLCLSSRTLGPHIIACVYFSFISYAHFWPKSRKSNRMASVASSVNTHEVGG